MSSPDRKRRRGDKKISKGKLTAALDAAVSSQGCAELAILHLFNRYDVNLDELHSLLLDKGLNASFSKVKYRDIAPRVGLNPGLEGKDMQTFDIHRARIPTSMFKDIVGDIEIAMNQYGTPRHQKNEKARSRYLAPLFSRTVALFQLTIRNTPESIITGRMTTKGRIEYHFRVFDGLSLLFVEVKYLLGNSEEHFNAIAQVIAECDALDYANDRQRFPPAIVYGVLCDGTNFEFFSFDGRTNPPTFSRGVFRSPTSKPVDVLSIANYHGTSEEHFICSLRPICETMFYFFLLAYKTGIQANTSLSLKKASKANRPRDSTPGWKEALGFAERALTLAMEAATKAATRDSTANSITQMALEFLQKSLSAVPDGYKEDVKLLRFWDEEGFEFC